MTYLSPLFCVAECPVEIEEIANGRWTIIAIKLPVQWMQKDMKDLLLEKLGPVIRYSTLEGTMELDVRLSLSPPLLS